MEPPARDLSVEIFASPGCSKCSRTIEVFRELIEEIGSDHIKWRQVSVVDELDYAVSLGVLTTPAIAVDGELVFTSMPSIRTLKTELMRRLGRGNR